MQYHVRGFIWQNQFSDFMWHLNVVMPKIYITTTTTKSITLKMPSLRALRRGFLVLNAVLLVSLCFTWFATSPAPLSVRLIDTKRENCTFLDLSQELKTEQLATGPSETRSPQDTSLVGKMYPGLRSCTRRPLDTSQKERGDFWVIENYIPGNLCFRCDESITYTTHSEFTLLDNLVPLVSRWKGPISIAVYASGSDFEEAVGTILYLRNCVKTSKDIQNYVSFHIFYHYSHPPKRVPSTNELLQAEIDCSSSIPRWTQTKTYRHQHNLIYPINVARNVAREVSQTFFVLASDVELYPSVNVIPEFLKMLKRPDFSKTTNPRVYVLPVFEVKKDTKVPETKSQLQEMLKKDDAINFHRFLCDSCHKIPKYDEWTAATPTADLSVFHVGKRKPPFQVWEPIYIGTQDEPLYDERLSWEGQKDKMTQMYILCVRDYEFHILDNAFLVHRPGIKLEKISDKERNIIVSRQYTYIRRKIRPEYRRKYGYRKTCGM